MRTPITKLLVVLVLALPGALVLLQPVKPAPQLAEGGWKTFPQRFEHWINEESALRQTLLRTYARLRFTMLDAFPTQQIIAGKRGRYFLATHDARGEPFRAIRLACGDNFRHDALAIGELNQLHASAARKGIDMRMLLVPSAPAVYQEALPDWLAQRCDLSRVPARRIMGSPDLHPAMRTAMLFPLDELRALSPQRPAYPLHYFHWAGYGPQLAAQLLERQFWQRELLPENTLPVKVAQLPSDVQHMHPGITLEREVASPDFALTRIDACDGPACFPELRAIMDKVGMVARYRNPGPGLGPRLVIIGDSFTPGIAPWLSQYHSEVVLVGSNTFVTLSASERAELHRFVIRPGSGDSILYVYHDAALASLRVGYDMRFLRP